MVFLCLYLNAQITKIQPLNIDDRFPDFTFQKVINRPQGQLALSELKDKHIIIDFWSRYCLSCISSFPKVQQLQDKFNDDLQIILANPHDMGYEKEVNALLSKVKKNTGFYPSIPIALNDTLLNLYFPHQSVPHYVWISKDRKIKAITSADELTEQNLKKFISNELNELTVKDSKDAALDLYSLIATGGSNRNDFLFYSMFSKEQPSSSLPTRYIRDSTGKILGYCAINRPLSFFIQKAYRQTLKGFNDNRIFYDLDKQIIFDDQKQPSKYCYEIKFNDSHAKSQQLEQLLQADLKRSFGIRAQLLKESMPCIVIRDIKNISQIKSSHPGTSVSLSKNNKDKFIRGYSVNIALGMLDKLRLPIINESSYKDEPIDIAFTKGADLSNPQILIQQLEGIGFQIEQAPRTIEIIRFNKP